MLLFLRYNFFVYSFLIITALSLESFCHSQRTHQYIIREGYLLLVKHLSGVDIAQLKNNLGTTHSGGWLNNWPSYGIPWSDGKIVAGAFREDEEDVVGEIVPNVVKASKYC